MSEAGLSVPGMAERVELWWARRQFSRDAEVPYPVGTYREAWAAYPAVVRQYHPDLNAGIALSQIPPAADVLLRWQCDTGHIFAATPFEQRSRPGRVRRKSSWCPDCLAGAAGRSMPPLPVPSSPLGASPERLSLPAKTPASSRSGSRRRARPICTKTPDLRTGTSFVSVCAPKPASAAEARLHERVFGALAVTRGDNAVRVARPFFEHREVWPDLVLPELRIAVEYDTIGRHGLEHVGAREASDRRKDRLLREAGWEVVRLRTGRLEKLGPHDLQVSGVTALTLERLLAAFRDIRGPLLIDAYAT